MAAAYRLIDGNAQNLIPDIKPLDQRRVLYQDDLVIGGGIIC